MNTIGLYFSRNADNLCESSGEVTGETLLSGGEYFEDDLY